MNSILNRRSVKAYKPDPVPQPIIEMIIGAGKLAPSPMNLQRYHITVVQSPEKLELLSSLAQREMLSNPALPPHIRERVVSPDFNGTYHAPMMVLVSRKADTEESTLDAALACENMMIAARALEIGSCWLGAYSHIWKLDGVPELMRAEFGIPEGYVLYSGIVYGYPKDGFPTTQRVRRTDNVNYV